MFVSSTHLQCPGCWRPSPPDRCPGNRTVRRAALWRGTPGDRGEPGWSLGNTPRTGLLPQQDYCIVHQRTGASHGVVWATHQQQDYCHNRIIAWYTRGPGRARVESGQHTDNRIIATTGLLHSTPGYRGKPGWSLGNTQTTGLLRQ